MRLRSCGGSSLLVLLLSFGECLGHESRACHGARAGCCADQKCAPLCIMLGHGRLLRAASKTCTYRVTLEFPRTISISWNNVIVDCRFRCGGVGESFFAWERQSPDWRFAR